MTDFESTGFDTTGKQFYRIYATVFGITRKVDLLADNAYDAVFLGVQHFPAADRVLVSVT